MSTMSSEVYPSNLVCHVCSKALQEPKILQCLHSVCSQCLADTGGGLTAHGAPQGFKPPSLHCPMCCFVTTTNSIDRLPNNFDAVESIRFIEKQKPCKNCSEQEASVFCPQCLCTLCQDCNKRIHVHRIFQSHRPIVLEEDFSLSPQIPPKDIQLSTGHNDSAVVADATRGVKDGLVLVPCPRHGNEFLSLFCKHCSHSVCQTCVEAEHASHSVVNFRCIIEERFASDVEEFQTAQSEAVSKCNAAAQSVQSSLTHLEEQCAQCVRTIEDRLQYFTAQLQRRQQELLTEVRQEYSRKKGLLEAQEKTLHSIRDHAECALWMADRVCMPLPQQKADERGQARRTKGSGRLQVPCNQTPSVVADVLARLPEVNLFVLSQRIDTDACVETDLRISFQGQEDPLEQLIQKLGTFYSKRSRERKFPPPVLATSADSFQQPPLAGSATPSAALVAPLSQARGVAGILYFLGCDGGIKIYQNPLLRGLVDVRCSALGYGKVEHIVHYSTPQLKSTGSPTSPTKSRSGAAGQSGGGKEFCTENTPFSWVMVRLQSSVELTAYSFYHDAADGTSHFLRSWEVRGCVDPKFCKNEEELRSVYKYSGPVYRETADGKWVRTAEADANGAPRSLWIVLDARRGVDVIRPGCLSACFVCAQPAEDRSVTPRSGPQPIPCKSVMLMQTGPNSNGNHHLMISSLELYGVMLGD